MALWEYEIIYGPGTDCEMCGHTADRLICRRDTDGKYAIIVTEGCTGSSIIVDASAEAALKFLSRFNMDDYSTAGLTEKIMGESRVL